MACEITAAHRAVADAIRSGTLAAPTTCLVCGRGQSGAGTSLDVRYHHHSYAPEDRLAVQPLCRSCHRRVHSGTLAEPVTGRIYLPRHGMSIGDLEAKASGFARMVLDCGKVPYWIKGWDDLRKTCLRLGLLAHEGARSSKTYWRAGPNLQSGAA
jgi:hypothetical protein